MYLPWIPYFAKLLYSDVFVVFDTVQYPGGKSFTNRNYIYQKNIQSILLTLPIRKQPLASKFFETRINNDHNWYYKHWKSILNSYSKISDSDLLDKLSFFYQSEQKTDKFTEYCISHLQFVVDYLGSGTKIVRASDLPTRGEGSDQIFSILKELKCVEYVTGTGAGSMRYLNTERFRSENINLMKMTYNDSIFRYTGSQRRDGAFLDLLFHQGLDSLKYIEEHSRIESFE
jgi:hypothetical protein